MKPEFAPAMLERLARCCRQVPELLLQGEAPPTPSLGTVPVTSLSPFAIAVAAPVELLQRPSPFAAAQGVGEKRAMPTVISPTASNETASAPAAADDAAYAQDGAW